MANFLNKRPNKRPALNDEDERDNQLRLSPENTDDEYSDFIIEEERDVEKEPSVKKTKKCKKIRNYLAIKKSTISFAS
jgi:hypothetical protein